MSLIGLLVIGYSVWSLCDRRLTVRRNILRRKQPVPCAWPVADYDPYMARLLNSHRVGEEIRGARNLERGVGAEQGRRPVTSVVALHDRGPSL